MTTGLPSLTRTVVAVEVGCKASPALKLPLSMIELVNFPYSSIMFGTVDALPAGFVFVDEQKVLHSGSFHCGSATAISRTGDGEIDSEAEPNPKAETTQ